MQTRRTNCLRTVWPYHYMAWQRVRQVQIDCAQPRAPGVQFIDLCPLIAETCTFALSRTSPSPSLFQRSDTFNHRLLWNVDKRFSGWTASRTKASCAHAHRVSTWSPSVFAKTGAAYVSTDTMNTPMLLSAVSIRFSAAFSGSGPNATGCCSPTASSPELQPTTFGVPVPLAITIQHGDGDVVQSPRTSWASPS